MILDPWFQFNPHYRCIIFPTTTSTGLNGIKLGVGINYLGLDLGIQSLQGPTQNKLELGLVYSYNPIPIRSRTYEGKHASGFQMNH